MDARHSQLVAKLSEHGWRVVRRERGGLDWWADEMWTVESGRSPQGFTVFLTWLVDPQWDGQRRPGQAVWAIGTCSHRPTGRVEAEGDPLLCTNHWPRDLPGFLAGLSALLNRRRTTGCT